MWWKEKRIKKDIDKDSKVQNQYYKLISSNHWKDKEVVLIDQLIVLKEVIFMNMDQIIINSTLIKVWYPAKATPVASPGKLEIQ